MDMSEKSPKTEKTKERPPVVVVMGHIDHGKSTLLDHIRKTNVTEKEKGGITQHMSAYEVEATVGEKNKKITFLDTPGHEAFQAIRSRGAKIADIAILVVAADDGVKPQTMEALKCIKEASLPYIVAINKIDKEGADIEKTKANLTENGIYLEGYGGDVPQAAISAKTGKNIEDLLELIGLIAELEDFKGDTEKMAEGGVLESNLDSKKGIVATLVIKDGMMEKGMFVASSGSLAPIRMMEDFLGKQIDKAEFSSPVRIIGWNELPKVGSVFKTFKTKKEAEQYAKESQINNVVSNGDTSSDSGEKIVVPIIIKADTAGSSEALIHEIKKLEGEQIHFKILHSGIGVISENDVKTAMINEKAVVVGFNVKADNPALNLAEREKVTIKTFDIIYKVTEWLKTDLKDLLPKVEVEEITGKASIIKIFSKNKDQQVIGGKVSEGLIRKGETFRITRRGSVIGTGRVRGLQHRKAETDEVKEGLEFGSLVESRMDVSAGDILEFFEIKKQAVKI